jgi:hypothetical protein
MYLICLRVNSCWPSTGPLTYTAGNRVDDSNYYSYDSCRIVTGELDNPNVAKLKDRHPATGRNVYGSDDPNV